jgi:hypothetical protein
MALGDGIRRNIKDIEPTERLLLIDAIKKLNTKFFPGSRTDSPPGGVSWWFKQDEIHQGTHVHHGPEFIPWHRELVNRMEDLLRQINPQLSLHYWNWTEDPRNLPNANIGGGATGSLNLFTSTLFGYGGSASASIGEPWLSAGFYVPGAVNDRIVTDNPADPCSDVFRDINGSDDDGVLNSLDFHDMREAMEAIHDNMHGFVNMGNPHISFRDPFVFMLHSNVDRLFARWQTDTAVTDRLKPEFVYGTESGSMNVNVEPWSGGLNIRPWAAPENQQVVHDYKHLSIVTPPCYDTNHTNIPQAEVLNAGTPPVINFNDVPSGTTTVRAAIFRVYGCGDVTIQVKPGFGPTAPFSILHPVSGSVTVGHELKPYRDVRLWVAYTAGAAGVAVPDGTATFQCVQSGKEFTFTLKANAIAKPTVAVMMALDQSGSMDDPAGTSGALRINVLKDAAKRFMEIISVNDGVGLIRFDTDAYPVNNATYPGLAVTKITSDSMFDVNRIAAINAVNNHATNLAGATSVGDGVFLARQVLTAVPAADYQQKALIVFTDGLENRAQSIADVTGSIDNRTFAIGLGNETQVNTNALKALTNSTGGYLLLTGLLTSSIDDYFRLSKYFLQILAAVTNNNIILDPNGYIAPGTVVSIPFYVTEADIDCKVVLMTDYNVVGLIIKTPGGDIIDAANAAALAINYQVGEKTKYYNINLPAGFATGNHGGIWHALLTVDASDYKKQISILRDKTNDKNNAALNSFIAHGAKYSLTISSFSNLKFDAKIDQTSFEPGAVFTLHCKLTEYDLAVEGRAIVDVEILRPDGITQTLRLNDTGSGIYQNTFAASLSGTYHCRFIAKGVTLRGISFTREQTLDGAVYQGGDTPPAKGSDLPLPGEAGSPGAWINFFHKCCAATSRLLWIIIVAIIFLIRR